MTAKQPVEELVAEYVEGGICRTIEEVATQIGYTYEQLTDEQRELIDEKVFVCCLCDWLMPRDYEAEDEMCTECAEDA